MTRRALLAAILSVGVWLIAVPAHAQTALPAECQPVLSAGEKQFTVPSHNMMTTTGLGPAPMLSESININGVSYVKIKDRWMKSPMSAQQMIAAAKDQISKAKVYKCSELPDETVNGTAAKVYSSHVESATGMTDTEVWVAKATGLPLKSEIEMNLRGRKSHVSVRYDYNNVKAPEGVN
jgi:hypothetical protein